MKKEIIAVIGLGYVGLPLAVAFGEKYPTIGYDIKKQVVSSCKKHIDPSGELGEKALKSARHLEFTNDPSMLSSADYIVVATPTPIDIARQPDLGPISSATRTAGRFMKKGALVIFESTVYPGVTEEVCVPILEKESGMAWKQDFHVGYSPERINPGDTKHTLKTIVKIVSADDATSLDRIAALYCSIVDAGVHRVKRIKEAEAAKVIENTQRDLNIALMNELAVIFDNLGIDTRTVLAAAGTKWNFLPFTPGLVGGHCIGVDPYYLTYKAETAGYHPEVILAGRRINDGMGKFVAEKTVKLMSTSRGNPRGARVAVLGLTFKEDCADLRNSRVIDIVRELESYGVKTVVHDPLADPDTARSIYGISLCSWEEVDRVDAIVIAVAHEAFRSLPLDEYVHRLSPGGCIIDVKSILDPDAVRKAGVPFWRL
ncbi:MAG: nucleotide sugar dehydrogenase [Deltaproteobacteria bacterium]|nr:nucleotide sugar dehydrogenase [Deltaproteobacteria bacterium]